MKSETIVFCIEMLTCLNALNNAQLKRYMETFFDHFVVFLYIG